MSDQKKEKKSNLSEIILLQSRLIKKNISS